MLVLASSPRTTSRLGAPMMSLSAPPASIGKRTAPPPTVKLATRSGAFAARKSAAASRRCLHQVRGAAGASRSTRDGACGRARRRPHPRSRPTEHRAARHGRALLCTTRSRPTPSIGTDQRRDYFKPRVDDRDNELHRSWEHLAGLPGPLREVEGTVRESRQGLQVHGKQSGKRDSSEPPAPFRW
jgi:hypothetical protein